MIGSEEAKNSGWNSKEEETQDHTEAEDAETQATGCMRPKDTDIEDQKCR